MRDALLFAAIVMSTIAASTASYQVGRIDGMASINNKRHLLTMVKGVHKYVFIFDDKSKPETIQQFGKFAADPHLSFTWFDAAVMSQRVRSITGDHNETR